MESLDKIKETYKQLNLEREKVLKSIQKDVLSELPDDLVNKWKKFNKKYLELKAEKRDEEADYLYKKFLKENG